MQPELIPAPGNDYWIGRFTAMASPCELLLELDDKPLAQRLLNMAAAEALRIEQKFSRYRDDNIIYRINHSNGSSVEVDEETARSLDYAAQLYQLSDGLFDITAGILRRVWQFKPDSPIPTPAEVQACLQHIGWSRAKWQFPTITLPSGMEIDLGGIGKEYAVDRSAAILRAETDASFVINYGGDLLIEKPRSSGQPWQIALDDPSTSGNKSVGTLLLNKGALATSGDARRHLIHQGKRYGHILNPQTGWPVKNAPRSITVQAQSCMEAGMIATLGMLQGEGADAFLQAQGLPYWLLQ